MRKPERVSLIRRGRGCGFPGFEFRSTKLCARFLKSPGERNYAAYIVFAIGIRSMHPKGTATSDCWTVLDSQGNTAPALQSVRDLHVHLVYTDQTWSQPGEKHGSIDIVKPVGDGDRRWTDCDRRR